MHINHGSMGHGYWPMTHVPHPNLLTHLAHDPLTRYLLLLCMRSLPLAREFGASIPQRVEPGDKTPQISHKNWGKELISTWISWKYSWFSSPCFRRTPLWNGRPWKWDDFHFYRAMHVVLARYCYRMSSVRPSVLLSVCPSVTLMYAEHIDWTSSKLITRIISLGSTLGGATTSAI